MEILDIIESIPWAKFFEDGAPYSIFILVMYKLLRSNFKNMTKQINLLEKKIRKLTKKFTKFEKAYLEHILLCEKKYCLKQEFIILENKIEKMESNKE